MSYFLSKQVKIFPSSYRGQYTTTTSGGSGESGYIQTPFDPESMMLSEYNWLNVGNNNNIRNINVYIVDCTENSDGTVTLKVVIGGYYFEIYDVSLSALGKNCTFAILLKSFVLNHTAGDTTTSEDRERKTYILTVIGEKNSTVDDTTTIELDRQISDEWEFVGLWYGEYSSDKITASYVLQITDENGTICKNSFLPEIAHGTVDHSIRSCSTASTTNRVPLIIETPVEITDSYSASTTTYSFATDGGVYVNKNIYVAGNSAKEENTIIGSTNTIQATENNNITATNNNIIGNVTIGSTASTDVLIINNITELNNKLYISNEEDTRTANNAALEVAGGINVNENKSIAIGHTHIKDCTVDIDVQGSTYCYTGFSGTLDDTTYTSKAMLIAGKVDTIGLELGATYSSTCGTYSAILKSGSIIDGTPTNNTIFEYTDTDGTTSKNTASLTIIADIMKFLPKTSSNSYIQLGGDTYTMAAGELTDNASNVVIGGKDVCGNLAITAGASTVTNSISSIRLLGNDNGYANVSIGNTANCPGQLSIYSGPAEEPGITFLVNGCTIPSGFKSCASYFSIGTDKIPGYIEVIGNSQDHITLNGFDGEITAVSYDALSDKRLKENITSYIPEKSILDLDVKKYDFINGKKNQIGCIAQDLQEICPEIVEESASGYLTIQESKIAYLLLEEVKKLKKEIELLKKEK